MIHLRHLGEDGLHPAFGSDFAEIGASPRYAAVMQFGAAKGAFGAYSGVSKKTGHRFSGVAPWGDIPARPFLGVSDQDKDDILATISEALTSAFR